MIMLSAKKVMVIALSACSSNKLHTLPKCKGVNPYSNIHVGGIIFERMGGVAIH